MFPLLRAPLRRAFTALAAAGALSASLLVATAAPAAAVEDRGLSGVYAGGVRPERVAAFGAWRGRPADISNDFLPASSWADVEGPSWFTGAWAGTARMTIGVPILPGAQGTTTLAEGARGSYNKHYAVLAQRLVASGHDDAVLRLGWEMNGNWFPWSQIGQEAAFAEYWRQIVTTMRLVPGARFSFEFNPTLGYGSRGARSDAAWPGDSYVDVVGLNVYDSMWGNSTATPQQRWDAIQHGTYNLDWWAAFAKLRGKPLAFPEWGLFDTASQNGGGGGDNPLFITNFLNWVAKHDVLYETYFNVRAQDGNHLLTDFPRSAEAYLAHFAAAAPSTPPATAGTSPSPAPATVVTSPKPSPTATATRSVRRPKTTTKIRSLYKVTSPHLRRG